VDNTGISVVSDYARQITQFLQGIKSYSGPTPQQYASPLTYRRSMIEMEAAEIKKSDDEENTNDKLIRIESPELFKVEDCNSSSKPKYTELFSQPEETQVQQSPLPDNLKTKKPPVPAKKPAVPSKKPSISSKQSPLLSNKSSTSNNKLPIPNNKSPSPSNKSPSPSNKSTSPSNKSPSPSNKSPSPSNKSPSPSKEEQDDIYAMADTVPLIVRRVPLKDPDDDSSPSNSPVLRRQKQDQEKGSSILERGGARRQAGKRRPESILREMEENSQKTRLANRRKPIVTKPGTKEAHSEDGRYTIIFENHFYLFCRAAGSYLTGKEEQIDISKASSNEHESGSNLPKTGGLGGHFA